MFLLLKGETEGRFDVSYYQPEKVEFYKKIKAQKLFVKLKSASQEGSYGILPPGDSYDSENPITFVRATEMKKDFRIDFEKTFKVEEQYYNSKRSRLRKNDILLAVKGATIASPKCVGFVENYVENTIVNGSIFRFQANDMAIPKYLAYALNLDITKKQMKYNLVANNAVDYLDKQLIENLLIYLPSFETQQTIINIFEQAYATKKANEAQAKALLASIDEYLLKELCIMLPDKQENSLKNRVFLRNISEVGGGRFDGYYYGEFFKRFHTALAEGNYSISYLESLCSKITDGTHYTPTYVKEGVKFISVKNVRRSKISFDDVKYITEEEHLTLTKRAKPEPNDILLTKIGTIGLACVIEKGLPEFSIFVSLALLKPTDTINSYFLSEVINSPIVANQFERDLKGTGVPDLHLENGSYLISD